MTDGLNNVYYFLLAVAVIVVLIGLIPLLAKSTTLAVYGEIVGHSLGLPAALYLLYFLVPRYKQLFSEFGTEIPEFTKAYIALSDGLVLYWYLIVPVCIALLIIDGNKFAAWHREEKTRGQAYLLSAGITALIAGVILYGAIAMGVPMFKLLEDLT